ncbi:unnamed protein product [Darwinula stevensoni]|uniref:Uncharacterized protein n=1 Tax=Darwinula stevensoni TaxID=69355 RepID=A0A7R9FTH9_9CRUS|nr:unnamed protein product [Darwinula stevensoni]CAG0904712.1 unnamed protein product [Darwinula stevensoni]
MALLGAERASSASMGEKWQKKLQKWYYKTAKSVLGPDIPIEADRYRSLCDETYGICPYSFRWIQGLLVRRIVFEFILETMNGLY